MSRVLPILFNTEMVRTILDGRKTVTRRICKDANKFTVPDMSFFDEDKRTYAVHNYADAEHMEKLSIAERKCPICPGDILYVRETWERFNCTSCEGDEHTGICFNKPDKKGGCYLYKATHEISGDAKWHPSIHMPKETARIFLKVTNVRVERLQEICGRGTPQDHVTNIAREGIQLQAVMENYQKQIDDFKQLWNSTIKKTELEQFGWDANPWVWVIEFERCEKPGNFWEQTR